MNDLPSAKKALPYTLEELTASFDILNRLTDAGPASLPRPDSKAAEHPVLRSRDLFELFDTTPDLAGADIDVSRFIRDGSETDVQVFWRDWDGKTPPDDMPAPVREELCSVPVGGISGWLKNRKGLWIWDHLEEGWQKAVMPCPAQCTSSMPTAAATTAPAAGMPLPPSVSNLRLCL